MDKNEIWKLIEESEKLFDHRKRMRFVYTVLFYTSVFMLLFYWQDQFVHASIMDILSSLILCIILSAISVLFNTIVFDQLLRKSNEEDEALENLRKRLEEKEQENNH